MSAKPYTPREIQLVAGRIRATLLAAEGEGEALDVVGDIKSIESQLADIRKGAAVEFESGMRGKRWQIYVPEPNARSYNTPRLVQKFSEASGESLFDTILLLLRQDVIRLSWQWKNLERFSRTLGMSLTLASCEITDGDDADIGVFPKKGYPSYKRVE